MKLELKHLAPYLPYGLKAKLSQEGKFNLDNEYPNEYCNDICTITDFTTYSKDLGGSMKVDKTKDYRFDFDSLSEIVIILRPLSDLTKEIEHNGEKFVPSRFVSYSSKMCLGLAMRGSVDSIFSMPVYDYNKLLEWHFDVFGLIDKGLSIDINTLK